jgi:hypothetical protein
LIAAELLVGVRIRRGVAVAAIAVALLATLANGAELHRQYAGLTQFERKQRADLAALEIDRDQIDPAFSLTEENSGVDYLGFLDAGSYYSAVDAFGSPAYTPAELAGAAEDARGAADKVFAAALGVQLERGGGRPGGSCTTLDLGRTPQAAPVPPAGVVVSAAPASEVVLRLRRYASETFPVRLGALGSGRSAALRIPADNSTQPWQLGLKGRGRAEVCPLEES